MASGNLSAGGVSFRKVGGNIAFAKKGQIFTQVGTGAGTGRLGHSEHRQFKQGTFVRYSYGPRSHRFPVLSRHGYRSVANTFRKNVQTHARISKSNGAVNVDFYLTNQSTRYSLVGFGKQLALFRFDVGAQTDYGWLELGLGGVPGSAPFVRLLGYAYDNTGQPIPAGAIPEPKRLPLALGALAFGAVGLREWRKKRRTTT